VAVDGEPDPALLHARNPETAMFSKTPMKVQLGVSWSSERDA
jgi:hypothetical protein